MVTFNVLKKNLKKSKLNLPTIKVSLVADNAIQLLATSIKGMGIEKNVNVQLFEADYNQVERLMLDQTSALYDYNADITIVFQSTHKLLSKYNNLELEKSLSLFTERIQFVETICQLTSSNIIYYNYPEINDEVFGNYANKVEESFIFQIRKLNYDLMLLSKKYSNLYICDLSSIQNKLGRDLMFDSSTYIYSDMVLSIDSLPYVAALSIDIILALNGKFNKCLILDLDNTLWGGVIGDDGLENIQIGYSLGIGRVFSEFQQWVKKLKNRGVIIVICSKNTESIAKEPFEKHPDMVLRLDDISVFIANWDNKVDNIRRIQQILNIGFDSMVFIDDNVFERNIVRVNIPEIKVPEMPDDPSEYIEFLYSLNLFETVSYSFLDNDRTKQYQIESQRSLLKNSITNEGDFLKNLQMVSDVQFFNKFNAPRIAQLSQRSNQFNLRTIRYNEIEIVMMSTDSQYHCFSFTLEDKFGDNGLVCVVILKQYSQDKLFIDTWFMSCRVLNRGMEDFVLNEITNYAKLKEYKYLIGEYLPTTKNKIVENHYLNLGFIFDEKKHWNTLWLDNYETKKCYINKKL